jgi:arylsulfatase A-like enzyme
MTRSDSTNVLERHIPIALYTTLGILTLLLVASDTEAGDRETRPPNVVVILVDDLGRADIGSPPTSISEAQADRHRVRIRSTVFPPHEADLGSGNSEAVGFRHTPHVERLFEQGIILSQYLTHTLCSPSRAGLLTGRHYTRVGSGPQTGGTLRLDVTNVARDLQSNGYTTAAFGKWHNGFPNFPADGNGAMVSGRDQTDPGNDWFENYKGIPWGPGVNAYGFDEWQGFYGGAVDYFNRLSWWNNDTSWWTDRRYTPRITGHTVDIVTTVATDFIVRHQDDPFFCFVSMPAPHNPIQVLRSDLESLSSRYPGVWQRVRKLASPTTGRLIEDVEELRCGIGEEFDHTVLDPDGEHFYPLVRATLIYAMDRGIGEILAALDTLGLSQDTIVWLMSDNGADSTRSSHPLRGSKGSLYEGGIRVPAAVWWPGTLDALSPAYADSNVYPHLFQYLDVYPTTMAMAGLEPSAADLDGRDGYASLLDRTPTHPLEESTFISFNQEWAVVRGGRWKLLFNEAGSRQQVELYDIQNDPFERVNIGASHPEIKERLIGDLHDFTNEGHLAMSYFPPRAAWITSVQPFPDGDILEVRALQTGTIDNGNTCGLFVKFATAGITDYATEQLEPSDLLSFDLFVTSDSDHASGFFVTPGRGYTPIFDNASGVAADGNLMVEQVWSRERWLRVTAGVGEVAPLPQVVDYIALRSSNSGTYHFYLDNVAILRGDGSTKAVIWASRDDTLGLRYRYCGTMYNEWDSVAEVPGFPFSEVSIRVVD